MVWCGVLPCPPPPPERKHVMQLIIDKFFCCWGSQDTKEVKAITIYGFGELLHKVDKVIGAGAGEEGHVTLICVSIRTEEALDSQNIEMFVSLTLFFVIVKRLPFSSSEEEILMNCHLSHQINSSSLSFQTLYCIQRKLDIAGTTTEIQLS